MGVIRNVYFKYIKIIYLCYSGDARRCRKADLETSRLFYVRFCNILPIKNGTTLQNLQFCINIFILTKSDATMEIEFSWDEHKAETNLKKHGVAFEDATLVFYDAHAVFKQDRFENGEYRWQAIGLVHGQTVLLVAHTVQDHNGMDHIRIISARQAEKKERKQYEQNRYLQSGFE